MGKSKDYIIPFVGLPIGKHLYKYKIKDSFFEEIDYSEIKKSSLDIALILNKQSVVLLLNFSISGTVNVPCDRCNDYFDLEINGNHELIIKIGEEEISDNGISISATEGEINIAEYIYEYIILSLPIKRVHPNNKKGKSTCNKEAIKQYNKYVIKEEKTKTMDPRWEKLIDLKLNK